MISLMSGVREINDILKNIGSGTRDIQQIHYAGISEILPTLYLSGAGVLTPRVLTSLGINFVVNACPELPNTPLPDSDKPLYLRIEILDKPDVDLKSHFDEVADMIEEIRLASGVYSENGKTLVHCVAGVSRSASLVIAYLMKYHKKTLKEAYEHVKSARSQIRPNSGFFKQLMDYELELYGVSSVKMIFYESLSREIPDVYEAEYKAMEEFYQRQRKLLRGQENRCKA